MPKASMMVPDKNIMMLLKGPPGFGKTIAACSAAVEGPILLNYFDKKQPVELLTFFKRFRPELLENIEYEIYGAQNAGAYLDNLIRMSKEGCKYVAVITDSATNLTSAAVNWSLGFRGGKKDKNKDSIIPDFDEYKVETSLVTQALDISRSLPAHIIWTCHPLPSLKIEATGGGGVGRVSTVKNIVTYGNKVGAIIPGNFTEIYHFNLQSNWDTTVGRNNVKRIVSTVSIGDDFAKTSLGLPAEFEITDKLFWEVWKEQVKEAQNALDKLSADNQPSTGSNVIQPPKWRI